MADFQHELQIRELTWARFIRSAFWITGIIAVFFILMWIFLI